MAWHDVASTEALHYAASWQFPIQAPCRNIGSCYSVHVLHLLRKSLFGGSLLLVNARASDARVPDMYRTEQVKQAALTATGRAGCVAGDAVDQTQGDVQGK